MDNTENAFRKSNPKQKANIISTLFFFYTFKLFKQGLRGDIRNEDIYEVLPEHKSETLGSRLEKEWTKQKYRKNPSLYILLWNSFGWNYVLLNMTQVINVAISSVANPLLIGMLVSYFVPGQTKISKKGAILYGCLLIFLNFIRAVYTENFQLAIINLSIKIKASLASFIYRKVLKMKPTQLNKIEIGRYTTIISNDLTDIATYIQFMTFVWGDILKVIVTIYVMYRKIGWYVAILVVTLILGQFVYVYVVSKIFLLVRKQSAKTDERITITKRILTSIRTIKMCAWEKYFDQKVSETRKHEVNSSSGVFALYFVNKSLATLFYQLCFYFILTSYVKFGEHVAAKDIYFVISSLQSISYPIIVSLPAGMYFFNFILNGLQRIQAVLRNLTIIQEIDCLKQSHQPRLLLEKVSLVLNKKEVLQNINFNVECGLNLLTGPVGSGKSIFLKLILGDFQPTEGKITCEGRISYASQEPWLFPSTIRQNIVFTEKYNEDRYYQVVKSCGLLHDFMLWEKGDQTIVAEHGINLSKGQQSRINLARAVYREADIYLIDDCFSVLDTIVADFVFRECILNLLKDKIVILVCDNMKFISYASNKIKMDKLDLTCMNIEEVADDNLEKIGYTEDKSLILEDGTKDNERDPLLSSTVQDKKVYDEEKESKAVSWRVYYKYLEFGGGCFAFSIVFLTYAILQIFSCYKDNLLSTWTNLEQKMITHISRNGTKRDNEFLEMYSERMQIIYIYAGIVFAIILSMIIQTVAIFMFTRRISLNLHKLLISKIIGAEMSFFSSHFLGNILNRLYQDLSFLDKIINVDLHVILAVSSLYIFVEYFIYLYVNWQILLEFLGSIILVVSVNSMFLIPTVCFVVVLYDLRVYYLRTAVNLKRLACSSESAMIGYMSSTLDGLTTIQVSNAEDILQKEFDQHQNLYTSATYMYESCRQAFTFLGDLSSSIFIACIILSFLLVDNGDVSAGSFGLAITQSFLMSFRVHLGISEWANFGTLMTSVERLLEYTKTKQERKEGTIIEDWPKRGEIAFKNVSLSYPNSQNVALKDLNFVINPGERVGIVGRTGSGKSSIISVLFSLYEVEGRILIDNTDIKTLSLDFLRQQIAVIPQDPFVFPGTIRENIDPLNKYPDEKLYKAMEISKLNQFAPNLEYKIGHESDLSLGQKQLICLARVLVRNTKIVIFDEAAENVDHEIGVLMKNIVTDNINNCTIVTVAHKLDFVMDCDKIILMHDGEVGEFGPPELLLHNKNGRFYKMYKKSL